MKSCFTQKRHTDCEDSQLPAWSCSFSSSPCALAVKQPSWATAANLLLPPTASVESFTLTWTLSCAQAKKQKSFDFCYKSASAVTLSR